MTQHLDLANATAEAMRDAEDVDASQRALLDAVGPITEPVWYDVESPGGGLMVVLPGWPSINPPADFVLFPVAPGPV